MHCIKLLGPGHQSAHRRTKLVAVPRSFYWDTIEWLKLHLGMMAAHAPDHSHNEVSTVLTHQTTF